MAAPEPAKGALAPSVASWTRPHTPGPLTAEQLASFFAEGYVIVRNLVPASAIAGAQAAVEGLVDGTASRLLAGGKIADGAPGADFPSRLVKLEEQFPGASVLMHKHGVLPAGIASLWSCDALASAAAQVLGPDADVDGHPVWNLRCKVPNCDQSTVPWHQDCAYLDPSARGTLQLTAWVPLVPATVGNGCMQVVRYSHRSGAEAAHECCVGGSWYIQISDGELGKLGAGDAADVVTCEVAPGDVLFLNNLVAHRSLPNTSDGVRWSLDLRWQRAGEPDGFYGIKPTIPLLRPRTPGFAPDWAAWAAGSHQHAALDTVKTAPAVVKAVAEETAPAAGDADPFDTVIGGPWMLRWPITHHNRHSRRFQADQASGKGGLVGWHAAASGGAFG